MSKLLAVPTLVAALGTTLSAADPPASDQQNTFVKTHCAVCHNDRTVNGGVSLDGFDAAVAAPSLAAMMLSKLTSGTALATVHAVGRDAAAAAALDRGLQKGAVNAAGVGLPPRAFVDALVTSFAARSAAASTWSVERSKSRVTGGEIVTASIVRELPSSAASQPTFYRRLIDTFRVVAPLARFLNEPLIGSPS